VARAAHRVALVAGSARRRRLSLAARTQRSGARTAVPAPSSTLRDRLGRQLAAPRAQRGSALRSEASWCPASGRLQRPLHPSSERPPGRSDRAMTGSHPSFGPNPEQRERVRAKRAVESCRRRDRGGDNRPGRTVGEERAGNGERRRSRTPARDPSALAVPGLTVACRGAAGCASRKPSLPPTAQPDPTRSSPPVRVNPRGRTSTKHTSVLVGQLRLELSRPAPDTSRTPAPKSPGCGSGAAGGACPCPRSQATRPAARSSTVRSWGLVAIMQASS